MFCIEYQLDNIRLNSHILALCKEFFQLEKKAVMNFQTVKQTVTVFYHRKFGHRKMKLKPSKDLNIQVQNFIEVIHNALTISTSVSKTSRHRLLMESDSNILKTCK